MRVAVCDDEQVYATMMADHLELISKMQAIDMEVLRYTDPEQLLRDQGKKHYDAVFLDIDMPEISGFDAAERICGSDAGTYIIFVTAKHDLVYDSFEYSPLYFICKATEDDLKRDLNKAMRKLMLHFRQNQKLTVRDSTYGTAFVPIRDILYIQSDKHYLLYHTVNNKIPYKERGTLSARELEFFAYRFVKPHQRYLVNMSHIVRFDDLSNVITLTDGQTVPVSKREKDEAFRKFKEYKRK